MSAIPNVVSASFIPARGFLPSPAEPPDSYGNRMAAVCGARWNKAAAGVLGGEERNAQASSNSSRLGM